MGQGLTKLQTLTPQKIFIGKTGPLYTSDSHKQTKSFPPKSLAGLNDLQGALILVLGCTTRETTNVAPRRDGTTEGTV